MVSHPAPAQLSDRKLHSLLAKLDAALAAHMAKRPGIEDLNLRARWALEKDAIKSDIRMVKSQLQDRWHLVEVAHGTR